MLSARDAATAFEILVHKGFDGYVTADTGGFSIEGDHRQIATYEVVAFCRSPEDIDTLREVLNVWGFVDGGVRVGPKK